VVGPPSLVERAPLRAFVELVEINEDDHPVSTKRPIVTGPALGDVPEGDPFSDRRRYPVSPTAGVPGVDQKGGE
jgi:hypothetical protein